MLVEALVEFLLREQQPNELAAPVVGCARCGGNHPELTFKKLENSLVKLTHWSMCPTNNEPILLRVEGAKGFGA
jgi:hypothetical protein